MRISVSANINIPKHLKKVRSDKLWKAAANELHRLTVPFVPMESGTLAETVRIRPKEVEFVSPYSHYQHEGRVMGPTYPIKKHGHVVGFYSKPGRRKHYTGKKLKYSKTRHPKATSKWTEVSKRKNGKKIVSFIQNYIDSGRLNL